MAALNKFNAFVEDLANGLHNFAADTVKIMLSNTAPVATDTDVNDIIEITAGNGYAAGGLSLTTSSSTQSGGVYKLITSDATLSAFGGSIGPFRYAVVYNSDNDLLIGWADYGSSITLADGYSFVIDLDQSNGLFKII